MIDFIKRNIKVIFFVCIILLIFVVIKTSGINFDAEEFLKWRSENIFLAIGLYLFFTIVGSTLLVIPAATFAIAAGVLFNPFLGVFLCSLGATLGAGIAFFMGRFFLAESIRPLVEKNKYLNKFFLEDSKNNALTMLMITRLVPLFPFNLQNYAYGITKVDFKEYMLYTFLFIIPGTAMYTFGAAGFTDHNNRILYFVLAIIIGIITGFAGFLLKKKNMD